MNIESTIREKLADNWLPHIYAQKIRSQRTRSLQMEIMAREHQPTIQYTLLGIEVKVGRRRFACPDLAAARYMRVFARIGCSEFAIPYDITKISAAADDLETSWQRTLLLIAETTRGKQQKVIAQTRSKVIKLIRNELIEIGPGEAMPKFNRETKQRTSQ